MSTVAKADVEKNSGKGPSRRDSYLEEKGIKSIAQGVRPEVPDEFDPDRHAKLKDVNFDDVLDFELHCHDVHSYLATRHKAKADKLSSMTREERVSAVKLSDAKDSLVTQLRKAKAAGKDISEIFADLRADLELIL